MKKRALENSNALPLSRQMIHVLCKEHHHRFWIWSHAPLRLSDGKIRLNLSTLKVTSTVPFLPGHRSFPCPYWKLLLMKCKTIDTAIDKKIIIRMINIVFLQKTCRIYLIIKPLICRYSCSHPFKEKTKSINESCKTPCSKSTYIEHGIHNTTTLICILKKEHPMPQELFDR